MPKSIETYGLIGHPLGHSFSKKYFTEKFKRENINGQYLNFDIENICEIKNILRNTENFHGFNVTIPYKRDIMKYLDSVSPEAAEIGAVNTVKVIDISGEKILQGHNTDVIGFMESITNHLTGSHRKALILGTGGASLAVNVGLKKLGIEPQFVSRTPKAGMITYDDLSKEIIHIHTVIVNCTPLGTYPSTDTFPAIPYQFISSGHLCFDLVYNPPITRFLELSAKQGADTVNGALMLKIQADRAWQIWNSK